MAVLLLLGSGCGGGGGVDTTPPAVAGADADAGEALFRRTCSGCHTFGHGDHLGPDLRQRNTNPNWVRNFLRDPAAWIGSTPYGLRLLATWGYTMPDYGLSAADIDNLLAFFARQDASGALPQRAPMALDPATFEQARQTYFDRCAGCHGLYRSGATGPKIDEARSSWIGTDGLGALIRHGTPRGMPNFGTSGRLGEPQIAQLAAYLQQPPPEPPALPMSAIQASWRMTVPVAERPTAPQHGRDWRNFFGVVERDASKVSIFDGGSRELVARLDVGFAVHILRSSATGRYFYAIGRDGLVSLIDLWAAVPNVVCGRRPEFVFFQPV